MYLNAKKLLRKTELYVALIILLLAIFIQIRSGLFFTSNNVMDILRAMIIPGMFGLAEYIVIISGGFDVSFPAVAALSMYSTVIFLKFINYVGSIILVFAISGIIGIFLGLLNGYLIRKYRFPVLIVTLGTSSLYTGILHGFLNAHEIPIMPQPIQNLSKQMLISVYNENTRMTGSLPLVFILLVAATVIVWFIMQRTVLGRSIFAIGGDISSAERIGIRVDRVILFIYAFVGFIAGITAITRVVLMDTCHPNTFVGMEMTVIAAVILGGTRVTGGVGSITGVMVGTMLFAMVNNSLQLMGIPTYWQKFFVGLLIIAGTGISAIQIARKKKLEPVLEDTLNEVE